MNRRLLAALTACLIATTTFAQSQDSGGVRGILQRTAGAILGQPAQPLVPASRFTGPHGANTDLGGGTIPGTLPQGQAVTDGPVYRPEGARNDFKGIFDGYTVPSAVARGTYPRVALTFERYGAQTACWTLRARIWQSARQQHDERFQICDAPMTGKDDLGHPVLYADPSGPLMSVIQSHRQISTSTVTVVADRTEGPNPPAAPFALNIARGPDSATFRVQYQAILARALVISGYATTTDVASDMRAGSMAGSAGQLMWVVGFAPDGNEDDRHAQ